MAEKRRKKPAKPQRYIDAGNFVESRRTWTPDWEEIDRQAAEYDARYLREKKRRKSA